jgi:polyribonucleotide nucleotidyltransferase
MHHYNDTPATYGETGPLRGPGNRAIGHGALAERALLPVLPSEKDFPYVIRVVSEVMGSNGSSSMASTCGSTLALMDAGVPITKPVAGIALGLASDDSGRWKIITDLQDVEDGPGGMDFKITGTADGVTAMQMDTKTDGLTWEMVKEIFQKSHVARLKILGAMTAVIAEPKKELSPFAPRIVTIMINPDKIRDVIGPGGKMINKIIDETGVDIDIEQDGRVNITSSDAQGLERAIAWVKELTHEVAAGEVYEGTVVRLEDFGAFVNILPGQDGLVHVSEIAYSHVNRPSDVLKLNDKVRVVVKEIDSMGRINLSIKALMEKPEGYVEMPPRERPPRRGFGGSGGGGRGGRGGGGFRH